MNHIWVQPGGQDRRVPVEGLRGVFFEHGKPTQARNSRYIQRRLADGDLVQVDPPADAGAGATPDAAEEHA